MGKKIILWFVGAAFSREINSKFTIIIVAEIHSHKLISGTINRFMVSTLNIVYASGEINEQ